MNSPTFDPIQKICTAAMILLLSGCSPPVKCSSFSERENAMMPCRIEFEGKINNMIHCEEERKKDEWRKKDKNFRRFQCTLPGPSVEDENDCFKKNLHGATASCHYCAVSLAGYGWGGDCAVRDK